MILAVLKTFFSNCVEKPEKVKTLTGFEPRDLAIPVRRSKQLSYEATDVGSRSFVGPSIPVMNERTIETIERQWLLRKLFSQEPYQKVVWMVL